MRAYGWFGLLLLVFSEYCLFRKVEPVYSWFYCFAWWSYILLADNLLFKLRGRSLFATRRRELALMLPFSVFVWLVFEGYNFTLRNWVYSGVSLNPWIRWPGYALSFATVLPGIFITTDLVEHFLYGGSSASASEAEPLHSAPSSSPAPVFVLAGLFLTFAPLLWPTVFFASVWIGPIFLIDPLLENLGIRSLSLSVASGSRRRIWCLLLAGFACGLMWEFWNFWAGSKWIYTVPYFRSIKLFEMPILGFGGFPPFAIECWLFYHLFAAIQRRLTSPTARVVQWLTIGALVAALFHGIDRHTILRFAGEYLRRLGPWLLT